MGKRVSISSPNPPFVEIDFNNRIPKPKSGSDYYTKPLVSIGMPVFNGAKYLRQALESLVSQDYGNMELIISDNASTDETEAICLEYRNRDDRIVYRRNIENKGIGENFRRVLDLAKGKYFMWAAHDDLWDKRYISNCVNELEKCPEAILCGTNIQCIYANGESAPDRKYLPYFGVQDVEMRIKLLTKWHGWLSLYGLFRLDDLRKIDIGAPTFGGDIIIMFKAALMGRFVSVQDILFYYRIYPEKRMKDLEKHWLPFYDRERDRIKIEAPYTGFACELFVTIISNKENSVRNNGISNVFLDTISQDSQWQRIFVAENRDAFRKSKGNDIPMTIREIIIKSAVQYSDVNEYCRNAIRYYLNERVDFDGGEGDRLLSRDSRIHAVEKPRVFEGSRCESYVGEKGESGPLSPDGIIHFVYSGDPLNDGSIKAPGTITNHLYRYLEERTKGQIL